MIVETVFSQTRHVAPFVSRREPLLLPVCCLCELIRDVTRSSLVCERWITRQTYHNTYGVNPSDCLFTHAYCPACFAQVLTQVRANSETARASELVIAQKSSAEESLLLPCP